MKLPHVMTGTFILLAFIFTILLSAQEDSARVFSSAMTGFFVVGGLFHALFYISRGKWIGGGDIWLGYGLGLLSGGASEGLLLLFLASIFGLIFSATQGSKGDSDFLKKQIPFGPFLIFSGIIVFLFSDSVFSWYLSWLYIV